MRTYYNEQPSEFFRDKYHAEIRLSISTTPHLSVFTMPKQVPQW